MPVPPLSIVVPVLDGERTLGACLDALSVAAPPGSEILVVDDGSTDGTAALAEARGARVLRHPENRGTSAARNTGWRASTAPVVAFVDADVVVRPDALSRLLGALATSPDTLGANGVLSLDRAPGIVADFANYSIHFQHRCHGARVASAFTSLCLLRRDTLERLGGWDERWFSRYADDVVTRFHLPPRSLLVDFAAQGRHDKRVSLVGLLRHRFWIGWFFVQSVRAHRPAVSERPESAVLALRYPINTLLAGASLPLALAALAFPVVDWGVLVLVAAFFLNNLAFLAFVAREIGSAPLLPAAFLSAAEAYAMMSGMLSSALLGGLRARTASRPLRRPLPPPGG